ncbi:MAG: CocE/NonD family hydrolase [Candidatus Poribacteria bacterium]|nr:CocE/NonD family hydrolase [Candidatus Poribacteria bacterium]
MTGSEPQYGIVVFKDVMVPMRDGVRLATDIYRPARDGELLPGPFPTILARTSYDKTAQRYVEAIADFFTPNGYVVVLQDLRGRHRSEGTGQYFHTANPHEGRDGYDTVEWIAGQPWSDGRVGTAGSSHVAIVQTHMALYRPPHLTTIWPDVGPINSYAHQARMGGAMQLHMFGALFLHAHDAQEIRDDPAAKRLIFEAMAHMRELVFSTPFKPGHTPLAVVPNLEKTLFDYYTRGEYDEYWKQEYNDFERHFDRHADIPGTFSGGWYDPFAIATTNYYAAMSKQNATPQRLIMGPWTHMGMRGEGMSYAGDVDFGPAAIWGNVRYNADRLRWFDRWLKDVPNGVEDDPPVRIFVMGGGNGRRNREGRLNHGGGWRSEYEWPLARTEYTNYFLHTDGGFSPELPAENAPPARFTSDPANPVPTIAGTVTGFYELADLGDTLDPFWQKYIPPSARMRSIVLDGAAHQQEAPGIVGANPPYQLLAARPDVLVFQTPPLKADVEVTGSIIAKLWISSSAVDTDFTAKLIDVYPPNEDYPAGYHMNLVDSIIRTRYRNGWEGAELMNPGEVYQVEIVLPPTSNLFKAGDRIRVDISSSNFPRFDLNPNTGEPMGRHTHTAVAHNSVYLDRNHPSYIVLPIIPQ